MFLSCLLPYFLSSHASLLSCCEYATCTPILAVFASTCDEEFWLPNKSRAENSELIVDKNMINGLSVTIWPLTLKEETASSTPHQGKPQQWANTACSAPPFSHKPSTSQQHSKHTTMGKHCYRHTGPWLSATARLTLPLTLQLAHGSVLQPDKHYAQHAVTSETAPAPQTYTHWFLVSTLHLQARPSSITQTDVFKAQHSTKGTPYSMALVSHTHTTISTYSSTYYHSSPFSLLPMFYILGIESWWQDKIFCTHPY